MIHIDCAAIIYRAVTRSGNMPPNGILSGLFVRRPIVDEDGLSIDVVGPKSCVSGLNKHYGAVSLHMGRVRSIALDGHIDKHPHGVITGVPWQDEDPLTAENIAHELAVMSRFITKADVNQSAQ